MDTVEYYNQVQKALKDIADRRRAEYLADKKWQEEHYKCCQEPKSRPHKCNCINADEELGFKNRFVQRYPNYYTVDDTDYFTLNFNTTEELMNCEFVSRWKETMDGHKFYRYSISPDREYYAAHLMAEYDDGTYWWCLGYLKSIDGLELLKFEPVYEKK